MDRENLITPAGLAAAGVGEDDGQGHLALAEVVAEALAGGAFVAGVVDGVVDQLKGDAEVGRAVERARAAGRPALVATFDPHPVRHFRPDAAPFRLTTLDQRERLFAAAGADAMVVFRFDGALAALTADCHSPVAALARIDGAALTLAAELLSEDGAEHVAGDARGDDPLALGAALARDLLDRAPPGVRARFGG